MLAARHDDEDEYALTDIIKMKTDIFRYCLLSITKDWI